MVNRSSGLARWIDERFPIFDWWDDHVGQYYAPKNFNFWYFFGSLALAVLVLQIVTGIFLTMNYKPSEDMAFASIEYIMRDVNWGWLIRYLHSTGASMFFVVVYLHIFRGIIYGSGKGPRELVWLFGMVIYVLLMAEAFMGYLLPWGQMSYWGAQVIISLFGAIPLIGDGLSLWIRGDYAVGDPTLNRFFALHVAAVPLLIIALVFFHIIALHETGSNNPDGVDIKKKKGPDGKPLDGIPFHPYYTVKDIWGLAVFAIIFAAIVFFVPEMWGKFLEPDNFKPADPMVTPPHIAPLWYFAPFYSILRAVPDKFLGVVAMGAAIFMLFLVPWLDRSPVKSIRYRGPLNRIALALFVVSFLGLGYLGTQPVSELYTLIARVLAVLYFLFFLAMPVYTKIDRTKPVPDRVTTK